MRVSRPLVSAFILLCVAIVTTASIASGAGEQRGPSFLERALQALVDGIQFGAIIAITAVGLSLVFGASHLINFAHGELISIGAAFAFFLNVTASGPGWHIILAAVGAVILGVLFGGLLERTMWRPLRKRGTAMINFFIITIGLSLFLRHLVLFLFGSRPASYREYDLQEAITFGPVSITPRDLTITLLSVLVLLGIAFMLQKTRIGTAIRAVSSNRDLAEASGIAVDRVILIVWLLGGGLAALGGVFFGLAEIVTWDMGFRLLLLMFAGIILGGLGSAYGAMVGSFIIGIIAQMSSLWFPIDLQNAWALLALIIVLLIRPQGILGERERVG